MLIRKELGKAMVGKGSGGLSIDLSAEHDPAHCYSQPSARLVSCKYKKIEELAEKKVPVDPILMLPHRGRQPLQGTGVSTSHPVTPPFRFSPSLQKIISKIFKSMI